MAIFQRQEQKLAQAIEEGKSLLEELIIQQEQYPQDDSITEEITKLQTYIRVKEKEYETVNAKVLGVKWLLED